MTALSSIFAAADRPDLYVIAEGGVNHDGSVDDAHALVDLAANAGADAIKFQTFEPSALASVTARTAAYQSASTGTLTQQELLAQYVLPTTAWAELRDHAAERGIDFLSTAFDLASLDLVCSLGVPALKVGSGELTNRSLLTEIAHRGLPVICSTGMANEAEVAAAVEWLRPAGDVLLLHCVSSYPAPIEESNLRAMATMRDRFGLPVGWSDHTVGPTSAVVAVALGAAVLEKHVTLGNTRSGPDHGASSDPTSFDEYVVSVRAAHSALGSGVKQPTAAEAGNAPLVRRSWHAVHDLAVGDVLAPEDLLALRPESGISAAQELVGSTVARRVAAGEPVQPDDVTGTLG